MVSNQGVFANSDTNTQKLKTKVVRLSSLFLFLFFFCIWYLFSYIIQLGLNLSWACVISSKQSKKLSLIVQCVDAVLSN